MCNQKILDRCEKLLNMSRDASSENEAAIAMRRLQSLMAKHNLEMSQIEGGSDLLEETLVIPGSGQWTRIICAAIAQLYFCKITFRRAGSRESYNFIGEKLNVRVAQAIATDAINLVKAELKQAASTHPQGRLSSFKTSFKNAAAARIMRRCKDMIEAAKAGELEDEDGNLMPVLASVYEQAMVKIDDYLADKNVRHGKTRRLTVTNEAGMKGGFAAGDKAHLKSDQIAKSRPALTSR